MTGGGLGRRTPITFVSRTKRGKVKAKAKEKSENSPGGLTPFNGKKGGKG